MGYQADVMVYGAAGQLVLAVEVKNRRLSDPAWATNVRRNLLMHRFIPPTPYFLLALPVRFYLWTPEAADDPNARPPYEMDPTELLRPYFTASQVLPEDISASGFEFIVSSFLHDLVEGGRPDGGSGSEGDWLSRSGLRDALRGGRVAFEAAV